MTIHLATKKDLPILLTLDAKLDTARQAMFIEETIPFHDRHTAHDGFNEQDLEESIVFLAFDEKENAIGFIRGTVEERKSHVRSPIGYIDELFVIAEARGKGVANALFQSLEEAFRTAGCQGMTTHTDAENMLSQPFYNKMNMTAVTVEFWKTL